MTYPKISIITPSYNQGQFLEETINSVLSQNYPNLEYMVVDGGSSDRSLEIIKKYEKHLTWWTSEKDRGQSHAINKGLKRITGEIFNWINSDDYYQPNALNSVAEPFQNPTITMATFRANVFGLQNRISRGTDTFPGNLPKTLAYSRIDQPETFFRMSAVKKMGLLNESLHYCMDKEWLLRYFFHFGQEGVFHGDNIILNFRYHADSKSVSQRTGFEREADLIYRVYAKEINASHYVEVLSFLLDKQTTEDFNLDISNIRKDVLQQNGIPMLNYYLYKRFREKYEGLEIKQAIYLAKHINRELLSVDDKDMLQKLAFRAQYFPQALIKSLRLLSR